MTSSSRRSAAVRRELPRWGAKDVYHKIVKVWV